VGISLLLPAVVLAVMALTRNMALPCNLKNVSPQNFLGENSPENYRMAIGEAAWTVFSDNLLYQTQ
jgi:hypothetical protein